MRETRSPTQRELADRFTALFEDSYDRVAAFVLRRVDGREDAADLTADVFRRAWSSAVDLGTVPPSSWLFTTARNVVGDHYRKRQRDSQLDAAIGQDLLLVQPAASSSEAPILAALRLLNPADRDLLIARYWDELSTDELAVLHGITRSAVWVRLHRAKRRLAAHYSEQKGTVDAIAETTNA